MPEDRDEFGLTQKEREDLASHGYAVSKTLGNGTTRDAFLTDYERGRVKGTRVAKIVKLEVNPEDSVTAAVNVAHVDVEEREIEASSRLRHPYFAQVVDNFKIGEDGRNVNVELHYEGTDLESLIETWGPLKGEARIAKFATQFADALYHLHVETGQVHRDLKPSNILMTPKGDILITDHQNVTKRNRRVVGLPTRGGAKYMPPANLNALTEGSFVHTSDEIDIYSFGATLYYALTGEHMFPYSVKSDENGRAVSIGDQVFRLGLDDGVDSTDEISDEWHRTVAQKALAKVPKRYRDVIEPCVIRDRKRPRFDATDLKALVSAKFNPSTLERILTAGSDVMSAAKVAAQTAAVGLVFGGGIIGSCWMLYQDSRKEPPINSNFIADNSPTGTYWDNKIFEFRTLSREDRIQMLETLGPYFSRVKNEMQEVEESVLRDSSSYGREVRGSIKDVLRYARNTQQMNVRTVGSMLRAGFLAGEELEEDYASDGEQRHFPSFVSTEFLKRAGGLRSHDEDEFNDYHFMGVGGVRRFKRLLDPDADLNVADIFARYFSEEDGVRKAIAESGVDHYFDRFDSESGQMMQGYRRSLPEYQQDLINTATAIYLMSDEKADVIYGKADRFRREVEAARPATEEELIMRAMRFNNGVK